MPPLSRRFALVALCASPLVYVGACLDSSSSPPSAGFDAGLSDAPGFDGGGLDSPADGPGPQTDGGGDGGAGDSGSEAGGDSGLPFSTKATCDAPQNVVDYSGNDYANRPVFVAGSGSPLVAFFNHVVIGQSGADCEMRTLSGTTWGGAATLQAATCGLIEPRHAAAGGAAALLVWTSGPPTSTGARRRITADGGVDIGSATQNDSAYLDVVKMGTGGHAAYVWRSPTGVGTMLVDAAGTITTLPENTLSGQVDGMAAAVDGNGDGYAFWVLGSAVHARAFRAGAWASAEASLASSGTASGKIDAAMLPNGDAYVIYGVTSGGGGARGTQVHYATGTTTFGAIDDFVVGLGVPGVRILSAADGELTGLWVENDGNGNFTLTARRRSSGAFSAAAPIGKHQWDTIVAAIDTGGHVTVGRNPGDGSIYHHRIAKGSTTWASGVRVDKASGLGTAGPSAMAVAVEPGTGNPVIGWLDANDLKFSICR